MDEKDIFNFIDNLEEDTALDAIDELCVTCYGEGQVQDHIKESIRLKLHDKINNDNKKARGNKLIYRIMKYTGSMVAAALLFIIIVNVSPSVANALERVPVIDKLVQAVRKSEPFSYDSGFENLIENGQYIVINKTDKVKGFKFTVNSIIADGSKLWISYDCNKDNMVLGEIKFVNNKNEQLQWAPIIYEDKKYIEVFIDGNLEDFTLVIDGYKDNEELHKDSEQIPMEQLVKEIEKYKIGTFKVSVEIDENIFQETMATKYKVNKEISTDIVDLVVDEVQLSTSRTRITVEFKNKGYDRFRLQNLRVKDGENNIYYSIEENPAIDLSIIKDKKFIIEFNGGIEDAKNLRLVCYGIGMENTDVDYVDYLNYEGFDVVIVE